jgi:membrane-bound ClpP family serine protease
MEIFSRTAFLFVLGILIVCSSGVASSAAEFDKIELAGDYPDFVTLKGEIELGDGKKFREIIGDSQKVTVILESPGGIVKDALEIGAEIRIRNYATMVSADTGCYSACALIWVAGALRYMAPSSKIGFHAVYRKEAGELRESGMGNAEVGSFLTHLGLRVEAIRYFTLAGPTEFLLLSPDISRSLGIDVFEQNGSDFITPQQAPR